MYIKILVLLAFSMISGCATWEAMSDSEKAVLVIGIVATTAIISSSNDDTTTIIREEICHPHGNRGC